MIMALADGISTEITIMVCVKLLSWPSVCRYVFVFQPSYDYI